MLWGIIKKALVIIYLIVWTTVLTEPHCMNYDVSDIIVCYRCPGELEIARLSRVPRHICVQYCVQKVQCRMISFDNKEQSCLIYNKLCVEMKPDIHFSSLLLHDVPKGDCISWITYEGTVPIDKRIIYTGAGKYSLVRIHYNDEILLGRIIYKAGLLRVKTVKHKNGLHKVNAEATTDTEFLAVSETCSVAWVPYIADRQMPSGVVRGGQKWDEQPLYVAALLTTGQSVTKYTFGHYDPENNLGYAFNCGVASNSSVDLLVEI